MLPSLGLILGSFVLQLDMPALYQQEGQHPFEALKARLGQGASTSPEEAAVQKAVSGIVWTPSMRRMYTLLDRCSTALAKMLIVLISSSLRLQFLAGLLTCWIQDFALPCIATVSLQVLRSFSKSNYPFSLIWVCTGSRLTQCHKLGFASVII